MPSRSTQAEVLERARAMIDEAKALPEPTEKNAHTGWLAKVRSLLYNAQRWIRRYPPLSRIKSHPLSPRYTDEQAAQGQAMLEEAEQAWPKTK